MRPFRPQRGAVLVILAAVLALALTALFTTALAKSATGPRRYAMSDAALATAREALIAYATARPIDDIVGPGYLPCPDLDDDGWAEPTCGSLSGETGQWQRLGRLPWKTLGLPDLRDAFGERLWYAVSSKHKGLLNCAASPGCLDMSPEAALGTITVRDATGTVIHDGTSAGPYDAGLGGAVAVVFAPGPPLARWTGHGTASRPQSRTCEGGQCNAAGHCITTPPTLTPKCDPANYLDRSPGPAFADEDNATFIDRNDAPGRMANRDGFIQGPVTSPDGALWVNDRLAVVSYDDVMPRVMRRVGEEVASCLRAYAAQPAHLGRVPWAAPACRSADPDIARRQADSTGVRFGRIPDTPFAATERDSHGELASTWRSIAATCRIADASGNTAGLSRASWWNSWKRHVFYALAESGAPSAAPSAPCDAMSCLVAGDSPTGERFAVLVAGPPISTAANRQSRSALASIDAREWLEGDNAQLRRLNPNPAAPECPVDPSFPAGPGSRAYNHLAIARNRDANDLVVTASSGARR